MIYYQDEFCYYFWKDEWIASSRWKEKCFLDKIKESDDDICIKLKTNWTEYEEYGMLNRLDNETSGLLYFAKDKSIKDKRKKLQKQWKIYKYYIADVRWDVNLTNVLITKNLAHHPTQKDRMICIDSIANKANVSINVKPIKCETWINKLFYDKEKNYSCLEVIINKWARHQIRCHLASIWCPIIWEKIYKKKKDKEFLHLRSVWVELKE